MKKSRVDIAGVSGIIEPNKGIIMLSLQSGILYGPITSRRLGASLGINLMPTTYKLCSFNCVYCHYGFTDRLSLDMGKHIYDLPHLGDVLREVERALRSSMTFDYITFSGNGEPTLHRDFPEIAAGIHELRNRLRPDVRIALLSNSTGLLLRDLRRTLRYIDVPYFKVDAGTAALFQRINRPAAGVTFDEFITRLTRLRNIYVQTVLMAGDPSNVDPAALDAYFHVIAQIRPHEVQIYSLDRPVPDTHIRRVPPEELTRIAEQGQKETGTVFRPFYL